MAASARRAIDRQVDSRCRLNHGQAAHLLSDLERDYFYALDFPDEVTDIREQYPLLPLEETNLVAEKLG